MIARRRHSMETQRIFAYGTLQTDHPEHSHCPPVLSAQPASVRGVLFELKEGYPLLVCPPEAALLQASNDCVRDWRAAQSLNAPAISSSVPPIRGQLLEIPLEPLALRRMDVWECFEPGRDGVYQRFITRAQTDSGESLLCWVYATRSAPLGAIKLDADRWTRL